MTEGKDEWTNGGMDGREIHSIRRLSLTAGPAACGQSWENYFTSLMRERDEADSRCTASDIVATNTRFAHVPPNCVFRTNNPGELNGSIQQMSGNNNLYSIIVDPANTTSCATHPECHSMDSDPDLSRLIKF